MTAKYDHLFDHNICSALDSQLTDVFLSSTNKPSAYDEIWPPTPQTAAILAELAAGTKSLSDLPGECLVRPSCGADTHFADPLTLCATQYLSADDCRARAVPTCDDVTQDERGVRQLISCGCQRAALNLVSRLLDNYGQGCAGSSCAGRPSRHTLTSVSLWHVRLSLLVHIRQFALANQEATSWRDMDTADLHFASYPELYKGRSGTLVPFAFRLLVAEMPKHVGQPGQALANLCAIAARCRHILALLGADLTASVLGHVQSAAEASAVWRANLARCLCAAVNCCLGAGYYQVALEQLRALHVCLPAHAAAILSAIGRVHIQTGDIAGARYHFALVARISASDAEQKSQLACQCALNSAFLGIADGDYDSAYRSLRLASQLSPTDPVIGNNLAVCHLCRGHLSACIDTLECFTLHTGAEAPSGEAPPINEVLVYNLCTLYELQSATGGLGEKLALLRHLVRVAGDGFNVSCLRLQMRLL